MFSKNGQKLENLRFVAYNGKIIDKKPKIQGRKI